MKPSGHQVTQLLKAWSEGETTALERSCPWCIGSLHGMARRYMAHERPGHTLQPTALVHEAYVRLVDSAQANFENRAQFFAVCAQVMRHILVDWARSRQAQKRGGDVPPLELDEALVVGEEPGRDLVALDDALKALTSAGCAQRPGGGVAVFRRAQRGGDGRGAEDLTGDGQARLEVRQELAAARVEQGEAGGA